MNTQNRYEPLTGLVGQLPAQGCWTPEDRCRWLAAMTAMLDWVVTVGPSAPYQPSPPPG